MQKKERVRLFVQEIWSWYENHKRILPWRDLPDTDPTTRAYSVMVSEIMLQQTQVPRVVITYRNFLERFPSIADLADASNKEVLMAWRGMGYNSRALRLRDAAKTILGNYELRITNYGNSAIRNPQPGFPCDLEDLMNIPGIGHYTAAAIRNFAFNIPTPCIDTNIRRILHRTFVGAENVDGSWEKDDRYLLEIAEEVLDEALKPPPPGPLPQPFAAATGRERGSADWHAALMDYGSLVQTKRNPKWGICPLTRAGIMRTTKKNFELRIADYGKLRNPKSEIRNQRREPGRTVGSTFIPNRIFRGRVVEALRDAPRGLTLHEIGKQIAIDWDPEEHQRWLKTILDQLTCETMLGTKKGKYVLPS
ncbi:hypothetical protein EXS70_00975 [Candidatus Peribacteria bacterium]|nr:hypothetical protein [Candidatus Peribacteria bacterium]